VMSRIRNTPRSSTAPISWTMCKESATRWRSSNQGELITQAPIEDLLAGTGEVTYNVTLRGDAQSAYTLVQQQLWVSGIEASQEDGQFTWQVSVTDEAAAEDQLMGLLVSNV